MTENELYKYMGKKITVECIDGGIVKGVCDQFIQALDNEPEVPSIIINNGQLIEIMLTKIKKVTEE